MQLNISISMDLKTAMRWVLLSLAFAPLVVSSMTIFPFVFGKTLMLRTVVTVFWVLFAIFLLKKRPDTEDENRRLNFSFLKNPLFILIVSFIGLSLVSTIFAPVPYRAFFGTIERSGGFINFVFLGAFLTGALLVFKRDDWFSFLKLSLFSGTVIAGDTIFDFIDKGIRPSGHFIGNPTFISAYLLFVLFAAFILIRQVKKPLWRYSVYGVVALSLAALLVANTRGALVGLLAGVVAVLIYGLINGGGLRIHLLKKRIDVRIFSASILILLVLSLLTFIFTIDSPIWKTVPGFDRLSEISLEDATTQSRLITVGVSLDSVNPVENGLHRLLIGYGPENFNVAYNSHYNPAVQKYDGLWFDRAHNQVLDVLVMHGILGLFIYLGIWFYIFRFVFKLANAFSKRPGDMQEGPIGSANIIGAAVVFFAVSYFVQNLFVFDQVVSYVPLFIFWGFVIHLSEDVPRNARAVNARKTIRFMKFASVPAAVFFTVFLVLYSFVPFYQMSVFLSALREESGPTLFDDLDKITKPYNFAQPEIRFRVLTAASTLVAVDGARPFIDKALLLQEEVLEREPLEPRYFQVTGFTYDSIARIQNVPELFPRGEEHLRTAMEIIPGRQEIRFLLAQNLLSQGRLDEAQDLIIETLALEEGAVPGQFYYATILAPADSDGEYGALDMMHSLFAQRMVASLDLKNFTFIRNSYNSYLKHFYDERDAENFLKAMRQSVEIEQTLAEAQEIQLEKGLITSTQENRAETIEMGIRAFEANGWDAIKLE